VNAALVENPVLLNRRTRIPHLSAATVAFIATVQSSQWKTEIPRTACTLGKRHLAKKQNSTFQGFSFASSIA
jgi:hypothetical protein